MARTFLVMAGGTGGHVYPALAAAMGLVGQGERVVWIGSKGGMEEHIVSRTDIPMHLISVSGLRGKGWQALFFAPIKLLRSLWQAYQVYRQEAPDCVLGMGGFVAGPGGLIALLTARPLVIHEQNAIAGLTNRWLGKWAKVVLQAFPGTFNEDQSVRVKVHTVGNPVREDLLNLPKPAARGIGQRQPALLILGGSRGAQVLNEIVPQALALLPEADRPAVIHQAGAGKDKACQTLYEKLGVTADVRDFIHDMPACYLLADLVICRSGALTLAELTCVGLASVLIPYPHAVDDHQTANASYLVNAGAAQLVPQPQLSAEMLKTIIGDLTSNPASLLQMAERAAGLALPDATKNVVKFCLDVSGKKQ